MSQLARLSKPFPDKYVAKVPTGGGGQSDYVAHSIITEALLAICGPFDWTVEPVLDKAGMVLGALGTLRVTIDGRMTTITEVGEVNGTEKLEGSALKNAASDALKRCAMRIGLGLHLWSKPGTYFLYDQLAAAQILEPQASVHQVTELAARLEEVWQQAGCRDYPVAWTEARLPTVERFVANGMRLVQWELAEQILDTVELPPFAPDLSLIGDMEKAEK